MITIKHHNDDNKKCKDISKNICNNNKIKFIDLFAGTGALGFEAISRGAKKTVFIESNKKNFLMLKKSILKLNLKNQSMLLFKDCFSWIKENDLSNFDLIFLDPPFNNNYEKKCVDI